MGLDVFSTHIGGTAQMISNTSFSSHTESQYVCAAVKFLRRSARSINIEHIRFFVVRGTRQIKE